MRVEYKDKVYEFNNSALQDVVAMFYGTRGNIYVLNKDDKELAYREFGKWVYC